MKAVVVSLILVLLVSCDYFENKKVTTKEILEEELHAFNWHDVDQYPTFKVCDSLSDKDEQRICFENTLQKEVKKYLSQQILVVNDDVSDVILMTLTIDKEGKLAISDIKMNNQTRSLIPQLDSLLHRSLDSLPNVFPAIKRSQHVSTEFRLPIELKIN